MRRKFATRAVLAIASVGLIAGCGDSQPGRTSGGMATGAGTGAAIGLIGGPIGVVVGAAVGAGAGALTATNTTPQQVNLGDPLWASEHGATTGPSTTPVAGGTAYGGMPPPQPLTADATPYTPAQPSAGATAMPPSDSIQSQSLSAPAAGQPTQLSPAQ
jgi:hypothetical protein